MRGAVEIRETDPAGHHRSVVGRIKTWPGLLLLIGLGPSLVFIARAVTATDAVRFSLLEDDAYYYLGVARHVAHGDGVTFNGITTTNGFHPLWQAVTATAAAFVRGRSSLVVAVVLVSALVWGLTVAQLHLMARRTASYGAVVAGAVALTGLCVVGPRLTFNGMESGIAVLVLVAITALWLETRGVHPATTTDRELLRLGALLALLFLARVDAALIAMMVILTVAWRWRGTGRQIRRPALRLVGPPAIVGLVYAAVNKAVFGIGVPVSGEAKTVGADGHNLGPIRQLTGLDALFNVPRGLGMVALLLGVCALLVLRDAVARERWAGAAPLLGALLCAVLLQVGYLYAFTAYPLAPWYLYSLAPIVLLAVTVLADELNRRLQLAARSGPQVLLAGFAALVVTLALAVGATGRPDDFDVDAIAVAHRLDAIADTSVVAIGDRGGLVCYLTSHPCVQIEGIVGDERYLNELGAGRAAAALDALHVVLYVHVGSQHPPHVHGDMVDFPEPGQSTHPSFVLTVPLNGVLDVDAPPDVAGDFVVYRLTAPERSS